jgi:hypothetical protein
MNASLPVSAVGFLSTPPMNTFTLYPSNIKGKRYTVYVPTAGSRSQRQSLPSLVKVDFGSSEHENYTIHKDSERKRLYRIRHHKDNIDNPYHAGFWAYHVLWNKPSLQESMNEAVSLAKRFLRVQALQP